MPSFAYRALLRLGIGLAPLAGRRNAKIRAGLAERRGLLARYRAFGAADRDRSRPLLWIHAASLGEARQAEAVLEELRRGHPGWQIAWTWFSPSASGLGGDPRADFAACLPWDRPPDVETALDALRPNALVFAKLDLWPELACRAAARGAAVGLIGGTVSPHSRRLRWPARPLIAPGYRVVRRAGAISADDAGRLVRLGIPTERMTITGDPRFDSALARALAVGQNDPLRRYAAAGPTLVAGSTWPEDEVRLLAAYRTVRASFAEARLILVPHEPTPAHLAGVDRRCREADLPNPLRLSNRPDPETTPLLVVDRIGPLPLFYADAAIAYVGGGFGRRGLHSVLEPAAAGVPTLFGPEWRGSPDAGALLAAEGAAALARPFPRWIRPDASPERRDDELVVLWLALLHDLEQARAAGARARAFVEAGLGAAARSAVLVEQLMEG